MKWNHLSGNTGYIITGGALLLTYRLSEHEIILFDSGSKQTEKLIALFKTMGVRVHCVLQTHLHGDHTANNRLLIETYGTKIYASPAEIQTARSKERIPREWGIKVPELVEDAYREYQYPIEPIPYKNGTIRIKGVSFRTHPLPGHSSGHLGFATPDHVFCAGDALLSHFLVKHAKMPYFSDITAALATIRSLAQMRYPYFALAHREIVNGADIPALAEQNLELEYRILDKMQVLLQNTTDKSASIQIVMDHLQIHLNRQADIDLFSTAIERRLEYLEKNNLYGA